MSANLYALFRDRLRPHFARPGVIDAAGRGPSFGKLDELAARFAGALRARGIRAGERVVAQTGKSVGALALYLGCLRAGVIYVPLNGSYTDLEVDRFLEDAAPALFVAERERPGGVACAVLGSGTATGLWAEALATMPLAALEPVAADDAAAILYTSGTTGRSKGVVLSHANLAANALALHALWGLRDDDVLLHALPIFHVHGLFVALHCALLAAATTLFLPRFDAAEVATLLPRATVFMGVPTFYTRLLALPQFGREHCRTLRLCISGSAPLLPETWREFEARTGHAILERYGMTETGILTSNPLDGPRIPGTVGYALPGVELRIVGPDGAGLPAGEPGDLEVRGANVFRGYWRQPEQTLAEFRRDGFFRTGDLGARAADGRITLVGRARDLIISGGFNVYPQEIEEALDALPGVAESAVVGVPHADLGEAVVAVVVPLAGQALAAAELLAGLEPRLARFKRPRRIFFAGELPRNAMGKVQKAALRARHAGAFAAAPD